MKQSVASSALGAAGCSRMWNQRDDQGLEGGVPVDSPIFFSQIQHQSQAQTVQCMWLQPRDFIEGSPEEGRTARHQRDEQNSCPLYVRGISSVNKMAVETHGGNKSADHTITRTTRHQRDDLTLSTPPMCHLVGCAKHGPQPFYEDDTAPKR